MKKSQNELQKTRYELKNTKNDLNKTQDELKNTQIGLKNNQFELKKAQDELHAKNIQLENRMKISEEDLIATKDEFIAKNLDQKREILIIKNPPYFHACGSNNVHPIINQQTIPYNTEGGGLDISTGIFVSPYPRSYSVTWSLRAGDIPGVSLHRPCWICC